VTATGPGAPFDLLWEQDLVGAGLPAEFRHIYGGDWVIPTTPGEIYRYSNFVTSHDGRVSFDVPGHEGGGDVSGFDAHDQWLMGLLRARADAVMVGANTLRSEAEHLWTAQFIFPGSAAAFAELRRTEQRRRFPYQVIVTRTGDVPADAAIFRSADLDVLVVTTERGAAALMGRGNLTCILAGADQLDLGAAHRRLFDEFGVRTMLCEGGPRVYGSLLAAGQLNEEFLTWSPVVIGSSDERPRPGLIEGIALPPGNHTRAELLSVRRAGDHLFMRTRYTTV
jgi:riboflavin biosynthesis pyrimidine reductase